MDKRFDLVENTTTLVVNSRRLEIPGIGNANEGRLTSRVEQDLPYSIELLAPMVIVGYPTYSDYRDGASDLFKPSTLMGGYKYRRNYRFSNGASFNSFHNIRFDDGRLVGMFGTRDFPEDAFPGDWRIHTELVETFVPHLPGMIRSVMVAGWHSGDERLHAIIESDYYFNHDEVLPGLHWRHVRFANRHDGDTYTQSEKITVVDSLDFGDPTDQFAETA